MQIAIAKEIELEERRVAVVPELVAKLVKQGLQVTVASGAGEGCYYSDQAYTEAGATISTDTIQMWQNADILLKVRPPQSSELQHLKPGSTIIGFLDPLGKPQLIQELSQRQINGFSLEMMPRTSRAQSMDALSSQAAVAGYQAVLLAAAALPRFFPMLTTAAGTIKPAKVFVIGAGVAGLQAIATARRLGAIVEGFDIRPAVKEEVQSLGAKFIEVPLQEDTAGANGYAKEISRSAQELTQQVIGEHVKTADVVITTAQVPGKKAPLLVTEEMIAQMQPGSVIVDLAAEQGGNCTGTQAGRTVQVHGTTVLGVVNLPSEVSVHASQMYSKNICTFLQYLLKDGQLNLDFTDDIISSTCVTTGGEIRNDRVKSALIPVNA